MADIYEEIWNHPESHVTVTRRLAGGEWENPEADVRLDEQGKFRGCDAPHPERPLFDYVNEERLTEPSFRTFITLLGAYTAREGRPERPLDDPGYARAVDDFLDAIFATGPMRLAVEHVRTELEPDLDEAGFRDRVRRMWFEPYTNYYSGADEYCVGFEHVFVGEDSKGPSAGGKCEDAIGGYHSWVKYYRDQQAGRADYLGHDYKGNVSDEGVADPNEASVVMTWRPPVEEGGQEYVLLKKPGGFFVGTRPECEVALGTVALVEVLAGRFESAGAADDHRRVKFGNSYVDLVLHPETREDRTKGPRIRTFYPKFRGSNPIPGGSGGVEGGGGGGGAGTSGASLPTQPHNDAPIHIVRALPNPPGGEDRGEWVELRNATTQPMDLSGWKLTDQRGRPQPLEGTLAAGETRRFDITRTDPNGMQLRNAGGWILLFERDQRRAAVQYQNAAEGKVCEF